MTEDTNKIIKFINIIEGILWIITLAVTTIIIIILAVKRPKNQANAQEVQYYLEAGIYELSGTPQWNFEGHNVSGYISVEEQDYREKTITLIPEFKKDLQQPENVYTAILAFKLYGNDQRIEIDYNTGGDTTAPLFETTFQNIYDTEYGYHWQQVNTNGTTTYIPVEKYTMVVKKRYQISKATWMWFNANAKKPDSATAQENYQAGYETGYQQGIQDTINNNSGGFDSYEEGYNAGQTQGYNKGYQQAMKDIDVNNPYTFNNLIGAVMRAPSEFFKSFWGTEILGFNLSGLISVMFTMALVFAVFGVVKRFI